jgi:hypothetical protein
LLADRTRIERNQKLADAREAKELAEKFKAEMRPVLVNGIPKIPVSIAARARVLAEFIDGLPPEDPERLRLAPLLNCLRRGEITEP